MEKVTGNNVRSLLKKLFQRYFVDAMSAMALGLFSSLIIGLIMSQLSQVPFLTFLAPYSEMAAASSPVVGSAIGAAIAWGLKAKPLVVFSCVVCGAFGYQAGGPVGAYVAAVVGAEFGRLVSGKTKVDIVVTPMVTIITGSVAGQFCWPLYPGIYEWARRYHQPSDGTLPASHGYPGIRHRRHGAHRTN